MRTAAIVFFVIFGVFFLLSVLAFILGKIKIVDVHGMEEKWENEKWEKLYYEYFAPISFISLIIGIICMFIYVFS